MARFGDTRQMGCTRADLERWLREMHGPGVPSFQADRIDLSALGVPVSLSVRDAPRRKLGLIEFSDLVVSFEYAPADSAAADAWITAFDRHTHRGGG